MNKSIGGINPSAVETALKLGAKVVWLPTQSAKNHIHKMGKDPSAGVDIVIGWKVVPELLEVFKMVKDYDVILERCCAQNMGGGKYKSNLPDNLEIIKAEANAILKMIMPGNATISTLNSKIDVGLVGIIFAVIALLMRLVPQDERFSLFNRLLFLAVPVSVILCAAL